MWALHQRLNLMYPWSPSLLCRLYVLNIEGSSNAYLLIHTINESTWCWDLVACEILIPVKFVFGVLSSCSQVPIFLHIILPTQSWLPMCCNLVRTLSRYESNPDHHLSIYPFTHLFIFSFIKNYVLFINNLVANYGGLVPTS